MASIQPYLNVPDFIVNGLKDGSMFRTGGVIQETANGQIVAWLREAGDLDGDRAFAESLSGIAGTGTGATGFMFGAAAMFLPFALSVYHTRQSEKRVYDKVANLIEREFWSDRMARYNAARDDFNRAYHVSKMEEKLHKLRLARDRLGEVQYPIYDELDRLQSRSRLNEKDGERAFYMHMIAMTLHRMVTICYLELDEPEVAKMTLEEAVTKHEPYIRAFVRKRIGLDSSAHQAVWQHPDKNLIFAKYASLSSFKHYIQLTDWLGGSGYNILPKRTDSQLSSIVRFATDSWATKDFDSLMTGQRFLQVILPQVYAAIENLDRLRGISLKVSITAFPGLTYFQWEEFEQKAAGDHRGVVTFVDEDKVSRWQKLRAKLRRERGSSVAKL
ncbi:MAG: hypothetical protein OXG53_10700 [Chloroflexi bacterium]|nr:hypothetical protein [Chloroflexota bacterium]